MRAFTLKVGDPCEHNRLDCKVTYATPDRAEEMAKDVAAFANANGGTLLIGVDEKFGLVTAVVGHTAERAGTLKREIEEAVRDWLQPKPVIQVELLPLDTGKFIVKVEVQPFPGQAVGVRVGPLASGTWFFPVRVGTQSPRYSPEQLVLLMDVALRRKVQLLTSAMTHGPVEVRHKREDSHIQYDDGSREASSVNIVTIDDLASAMQLTFEGKSTWIPLDAVKAVWRSGDAWTMHLDGQLKHAGSTLFLRGYEP